MRNKLTILAFIVILMIIILRIPTMMFWNGYLTGDDTSIYMETAKNICEGKGFVSSICRHIPDKKLQDEYVNKFGNRYQSLRIAPLYIYTISIIYSITGLSNFMQGINLLNLALFILLIYLLYAYTKKTYPGNQWIPILSIAFVGFNSLLYEISYGASMEIMNLLFFFASYLMHLRILKNDNPRLGDVLIYSLLISALFLSKYSAIPYVMAFLLHHLVRRSYKVFLISALTTAVLIFPWFILRNMILDGKVISDFSGFPFSDLAGLSGIVPSFVYFLYARIRVLGFLLQDIININGLCYLTPFAVKETLVNPRQKNNQLHIVIFLVVTSFYIYYGYINLRYLLPLFVVLIPVAVNEIMIYIEKYSRNSRIIIISVIALIILLSQFMNISELSNSIRKKAAASKSVIESSLLLLKENGVAYDDMVLTNILGFNVHSASGVVLVDPLINEKNKAEMIKTFDIDYVLFSEGEARLPQNIFTDMKLLGKTESGNRIYLYSVEPSEP